MPDEPRVGILVGSSSDLETMARAQRTLEELGIAAELKVASAHRTPDLVRAYAASAASRGLQVVICGAGMAAHLAGVVASLTDLPVIGVPLAGGLENGLDALLATVQMPAGVPVATVAVGKAGATNAAVLAARIIALYDENVRKKLADYKRRLAETVADTDKKAGDAGA